MLDCRLVVDGDLLTDLVEADTALDQCFAQNVQVAHIPLVGAGLLANAVGQPMNLFTDTPHSRASPLPHFDLGCVRRVFISAKKRPEQVGA